MVHDLGTGRSELALPELRWEGAAFADEERLLVFEHAAGAAAVVSVALGSRTAEPILREESQYCYAQPAPGRPGLFFAYRTNAGGGEDLVRVDLRR